MFQGRQFTLFFKMTTSAAAINMEELEQKILAAFDAISEIETDIDELNAQQAQEESKLAYSFDLKKQPLYAKRDAKLADIPEFWSIAMENHGVFGSVMSESDKELAKYIKQLSVTRPISQDGDGHAQHTYVITIKLADNDIIKSDTLTKNLHTCPSGNVSLTQTPIEWGTSEHAKAIQADPESFFKFFDETDEEQLEDVMELAQIIMLDFYPNALSYYQGIDDDDLVSDDEEAEWESAEEDDEEEK